MIYIHTSSTFISTDIDYEVNFFFYNTRSLFKHESLSIMKITGRKLLKLYLKGRKMEDYYHCKLRMLHFLFRISVLRFFELFI